MVDHQNSTQVHVKRMHKGSIRRFRFTLSAVISQSFLQYVHAFARLFDNGLN